MWIVRVALQRPYTFIMLAILIVFMGIYAILNTATDIFPNIRIPIAAVIYRYSGLLPEEMATRIILLSERSAQTVVNDVEHTESQSVNGTSVVKYFFQPDANPALSFAQIVAVSQAQLHAALQMLNRRLVHKLHHHRHRLRPCLKRKKARSSRIIIGT